jgi:hypothetical protein
MKKVTVIVGSAHRQSPRDAVGHFLHTHQSERISKGAFFSKESGIPVRLITD